MEQEGGHDCSDQELFILQREEYCGSQLQCTTRQVQRRPQCLQESFCIPKYLTVNYHGLKLAKVTTERAKLKEPMEGVELHAFCDTSGSGTSENVYAVITQTSEVCKGLKAAKSRLAVKYLTISRFKNLCRYTCPANLVDNVRAALEGYPIKSVHGWIDRTVALHWIKGVGTCRK